MNENKSFTMQKLYSSKENLKILSGTISAMEVIEYQKKKYDCAIIYYGTTKVLIPIQEMGIEQNRKYLRNMLGASIDFIIIEIDETSNIAIASRKKAMEIKQKIEFEKYFKDDIVKATVISIGIKHIKVNCLGKDINLRIDDLAYGYMQDVNEFYSIGDEIEVKILEIDKENYNLKLSVKELLEDPYKNIRIYITEGGEYIGKITGYAPNGLYIKLNQGVDALAILPIWMNNIPEIESKVLVRIHSIDEKKRKIYCSILRVIRNSKMEENIWKIRKKI